ncbi:HPP family-domain-containing protein [Coniella lustricola]|uniref:HPP family-domain-containing protein n=1 Tax=Coniella lustricola TaxID=2025994 RepID=A0A2T3A7F0_9PEZI|nr:HPP family-domain-containing protein [Coniella lustricola]
MGSEKNKEGSTPRGLNIDVDRFLNPLIPAFHTQRLPSPIKRFLGFRDRPSRPLGNVLVMFWSCFGTLGALLLIWGVCEHVPAVKNNDASRILGSFGAAAVLEFYAIEAPLSQPRNMFVGQLGSSIIGVAINKGFAQLPTSQYSYLRWVGGSISCACATVYMGLTGSTHPPAGATALLAVTDDKVTVLGWMLVPVVLLHCALMFVVALLVNNIQRVYPQYWWTQEDVGSFWTRKHDDRRSSDEENIVKEAKSDHGDQAPCQQDGIPSVDESSALVVLTRRGIVTLSDVHLTTSDRLCLEQIVQRLSRRSSASLTIPEQGR